MKRFITGFALILLAAACLPGCVTAPSQPTPAKPLVTVAVTQCGGLVAMYIVLDPTHMIRASAKELTTFLIDARGQVTEQHHEPLDFNALMALGQTSLIATRVEMACAQPGVST